MPADPRKLLQAFNQACQEVPERVPGYRKELLDAVADVVSAEREYTVRYIPIQQRVSDICDRLGDFLASRTKADKKNQPPSDNDRNVE
jgi:hypothetical protein